MYDIIIADDSGACYGVKRALYLTKRARKGPRPVHSLGPLIHNPQVVGELAGLGIGVANSLDEASCGTLVLRSHGTAPQIIDEAHARGFNVIDATCPFVAKVQKQAQKFALDGYAVVIVGEPGHAEVEGIRAWGGDAVVTVADSPDKLPVTLPERVGIVVQTTQSKACVDAVVAAVREKAETVVLADTVCFATQQRQKAAAQLAQEVDVMLVLGGHNSGNTKRLFQICRAICPQTHHIETPAEADASWFEDVVHVGITAGASTPAEQIEALVQHLNSLQGLKH